LVSRAAAMAPVNRKISAASARAHTRRKKQASSSFSLPSGFLTEQNPFLFFYSSFGNLEFYVSEIAYVIFSHFGRWVFCRDFQINLML